jgi:hypothetical protein
MNPKQLLSWIEDKALLCGAFLWSAAEFIVDIVILLPIQWAFGFVVGEVARFVICLEEKEREEKDKEE